jgi:hypothetical protein
VNEDITKAVWAMAHSTLRNYIAPGLTSYLIGGEGHGKVRLFHSDRDRFDFTCLVLKGSATNILFQRQWGNDGDLYAPGTLKRRAEFGDYEYVPGEKAETFIEKAYTYGVGETYSMKANQIHSIRFARGSEVLFFEGPEVADSSIVLEPWSNGKRIPTFVTQPWMFERESATS